MSSKGDKKKQQKIRKQKEAEQAKQREEARRARSADDSSSPSESPQIAASGDHNPSFEEIDIAGGGGGGGGGEDRSKTDMKTTSETTPAAKPAESTTAAPASPPKPLLVRCDGCSMEVEATLQCPDCQHAGDPRYFCSRECFKANWSKHKRLVHTAREKGAQASTSKAGAVAGKKVGETTTMKKASEPLTTKSSQAIATAQSNGEVTCIGCGIKTPPTLQCPACKKNNIPGVYFCNRNCFKDNWPLHKERVHDVAAPSSSASLEATKAVLDKQQRTFEEGIAAAEAASKALSEDGLATTAGAIATESPKFKEGLKHLNADRLDASMEAFAAASLEFKTDGRGEPNCLTMMAQIHMRKEQFSEALTKLDHAVKIFDSILVAMDRSKLLQALGGDMTPELLSAIGNPVLFGRAVGAVTGCANAHLVRGELHAIMGKLSSARSDLTSAHSVFETLKDYKNLAACCGHLGQLAERTGDSSGAMRYLETAAQHHTTVGDFAAAAAMWRCRATVGISGEDESLHKNREQFVSLALQLCLQHKLPLEEARCRQTLALVRGARDEKLWEDAVLGFRKLHLNKPSEGASDVCGTAHAESATMYAALKIERADGMGIAKAKASVLSDAHDLILEAQKCYPGVMSDRSNWAQQLVTLSKGIGKLRNEAEAAVAAEAASKAPAAAPTSDKAATAKAKGKDSKSAKKTEPSTWVCVDADNDSDDDRDAPGGGIQAAATLALSIVKEHIAEQVREAKKKGGNAPVPEQISVD